MSRCLLQRIMQIGLSYIVAISGLILVVPGAMVLAAQDCDANAVIYCGVSDQNNLQAKYRMNQNGNVQTIFAHFGIRNETDLNDMQIGRVTKTGEIYIGSRLVANQAITAGRKYMSGSTRIQGVEAYERSPSVSFRSDSLPALVKMVDDRFHFAVIMSCGNPVLATPVIQPSPTPPPAEQPNHPNLLVKKTVRQTTDTQWSERIAVDPGSNLEYRITITNSGDTFLKNLLVKDTLPKNVSYENNPLRGSQELGDIYLSTLIEEGITIQSLNPGQSVEIIYAVSTGNDTDACEVSLNNSVTVRTSDVPEQRASAFVTICQPKKLVPVKKVVPPPSTVTLSKLPSTGITDMATIFSLCSFLGLGLYKLKDFYEYLLR